MYTLEHIGYDVKVLNVHLNVHYTRSQIILTIFGVHLRLIFKKMVDIVLNHSNIQYSVDVTLYFYYTSILAIPPSFGVSKTLDIINNKNFTPKIYKSNENCSKKWYNNHFFPMKYLVKVVVRFS